MIGAAIITQDERKDYRDAILQISQLAEVLEKSLVEQKPLDETTKAMLERMTGTGDPANQLRLVKHLHLELDQQYDEHLRYSAQFKLSPFCEYMFRDEVPALHHELLIDHMEAVHNKEIMQLMISMPPGAAKSSYSSIRFPAWHLGRRPNERFLQGAHTQTFAKDRLGKPVRSLIQDTRYTDVFPEMKLSASSAAADYFEFQGTRGYYKAVGVGVGIAGFRADIAGVDDPIASREDAESATVRRKLHDWWEDDFGTRPMPGSPVYIVNTRWHEDDLSGHLLHKWAEGKGDPWTVINIPALATENDPLGREQGEGLWPEVFGTEFYMKKKRSLTGRSWNSLYMGNPVDEEGGVLKRADVKRYKNVPADKIRQGAIVNKVVKRITMSVDCAEKATQRSDFSAITIWIETFDKKHYLVHAVRAKKEFPDMVRWIDHVAKTWKVDSILVEDRGAGTQYIQVRQKAPGPAPVISIQTMQKSKEFRFDGVTPMFGAGEVLLPESGVDWIADLEAEIFAFPNGRNDDYVDTISQYLAHSRKSGVRRGVVKMQSGFTRQ